MTRRPGRGGKGTSADNVEGFEVVFCDNDAKKNAANVNPYGLLCLRYRRRSSDGQRRGEKLCQRLVKHNRFQRDRAAKKSS